MLCSISVQAVSSFQAHQLAGLSSHAESNEGVDVNGASTENVAGQGWDDERGKEEVRDEIAGSGGGSYSS